MPQNDETAASGQAACDCLQCRIGLAYVGVRPKEPTDEERALLLGALISTLAMEIARHPAPADELLMQAQLDLIATTLAFIQGDRASATKH